MNIIDRDCFTGLSVGKRGENCRRDGLSVSAEFKVALEHEIAVFVNGCLTMRLVCSPELLPELVLGRLYTEGIIRGTEDVEHIRISRHGSCAEVVLFRDGPAAAEEQGLNGRTIQEAELRPVESRDWKREWVYTLAERFELGMPVYGETHGTHSCFLAQEGTLLYCCEDLGRHNALDKMVGCALRDGVDLRRTMVYTSGRIPTDMVIKTVRAGIPVLISKTVPTDRAVEAAKKYNLTLICTAQPRRMTIYHQGIPNRNGDTARRGKKQRIQSLAPLGQNV